MTNVIISPDRIKQIQQLDSDEQVKLKIRSCVVCNKTSLEKMNLCSSCKSAYYCSRECQIKDWPMHKNNCKVHKAVKAIQESILQYSEALAPDMLPVVTFRAKAGILRIDNPQRFLSLVNSGHNLIQSQSDESCTLPYCLTLYRKYEDFIPVFTIIHQSGGYSQVLLDSLIAAAGEITKRKRYMLVVVCPVIGYMFIKEIV